LTQGDILFDQYTNNKQLSNKEKLQLLNQAKDAYIQSRTDGAISEIYYLGAIKVIDEEISELSGDGSEIADNV
jgi:hypothetical protein